MQIKSLMKWHCESFRMVYVKSKASEANSTSHCQVCVAEMQLVV
jgi:hypothetical protein